MGCPGRCYGMRWDSVGNGVPAPAGPRLSLPYRDRRVLIATGARIATGRGCRDMPRGRLRAHPLRRVAASRRDRGWARGIAIGRGTMGLCLRGGTGGVGGRGAAAVPERGGPPGVAAAPPPLSSAGPRHKAGRGGEGGGGRGRVGFGAGRCSGRCAVE